jgi:hypothetical protein
MKIVDRIFGVLLILGTCGHIAGTLKTAPPMSSIWIWSLGAGLGGLVLGPLHLVRAGRPNDRAVALIATLGSVGWFFIALAFGVSIHHVLDFRPFGHMIISAVLVGFGLRTLLGGAGNPAGTPASMITA